MREGGREGRGGGGAGKDEQSPRPAATGMREAAGEGVPLPAWKPLPPWRRREGVRAEEKEEVP